MRNVFIILLGALLIGCGNTVTNVKVPSSVANNNSTVSRTISAVTPTTLPSASQPIPTSPPPKLKDTKTSDPGLVVEPKKDYLGDDVVIVDDEAKSVEMSADLDVFWASIKMSLDHDDAAYKALLASGQLYFVKNGTKGRYVEVDTKTRTVAKVYINEGKYKGRYAWLPEGFLRNLNR